MKKMPVLMNAVALYLGVDGEDAVIGNLFNETSARSYLDSLSLLLFGCSLVGIGLLRRRKYSKRPSH